MRHRLPICAATLVFAAACADTGPAEPEIGVEAEAYLTEALDVMQFNSVRRRSVDWPDFRRQAVADARALNARTPVDVHPVIEEALHRLGDGHSFFAAASPLEPAPREEMAGDLEVAGDVAVVRLEGQAGYVRIGSFLRGGVDADALVDRYHAAMRAVEAGGEVCRWVVDVRGNGGGNMWPMLAAVGPLLGRGPVGYFLYPDGMLAPWVYEDGGAGLDEGPIAATSDPWVSGATLWVAVLTDSLTASAGEAVAIAFRGTSHARSFGSSTWGVSTGNAAFPLADGSVIFLSVATMVDREGEVYGSALIPDEVVSGPTPDDEPASDLVLGNALRWLDGQACS